MQQSGKVKSYNMLENTIFFFCLYNLSTKHTFFSPHNHTFIFLVHTTNNIKTDHVMGTSLNVTI